MNSWPILGSKFEALLSIGYLYYHSKYEPHGSFYTLEKPLKLSIFSKFLIFTATKGQHHLSTKISVHGFL